MTKYYLQDTEEEAELASKFEFFCEIAGDQEKFQATKQNNITSSVDHSSSVLEKIGTCSFLRPRGWIKVPKRSRSKATRGEVLLSDSFCKLNLKGYVVDHDYLNDKEVSSGSCKLSGKRSADDYDYSNDKKVLRDVKGKKILRNYYDSDEKEYEYSEKKKKPGHNIVVKNNNVVEIASLPVGFENRIRELGGYDVKLIIQKHITYSDTNITQNRFLIPVKQIRPDAKDFLTENEISLLPIKVPLIQPNLCLTRIMLRKWNWSDKSSFYALNGPWTAVLMNHILRAGMVMQLWSFRVDGILFMALVNVSRDNELDHVINANAGQIHAESHNQQHAMEENESDRQGAWACCSQAQGCSSSKSYFNQLDDID